MFVKNYTKFFRTLGIGFFVGVVIVISLNMTGCTRSMVKKAVADSAKDYVNEMGLEYIGSSSTGTDNDGDGYVSVDVRVKEGSTTKTLNLECTYSFVGFTTGCKERLILKNK